MTRTWLRLAAGLGLGVLACLALFGAGSAGAASPAIELSKHERALVAQAKARGETTITLIIASKGKANGRVASELTKLGATIGYREDSIDYVRAAVPLDKLEAVLAVQDLFAVDVDEEVPVGDPTPTGIAPIIPRPAPNAATPRENAYMPTQDTRAAQFVNAHPTWDGRGVTIGIVDTGVSLDHPSLLTTSTGEAKVVNWITGTSPFDSGAALDPTWLNMQTQVSGPTFTFDGKTFTAPAGSFRVAFFNEAHPRFGGEFSVAGTPGGDLNRDGDETDKFYVLWNPTSNAVYVDVDQDNSFADEPAMTDYKVNRDIRKFGTDNPATAVKEEVPFVVQTDGKNKFVNLGIVAGAHASHVAGIATGNALFGGQMSGAAPGAKIVSSRACLWLAGCFAHALNEGMIEVAKQENVDVINMSIGGLPALNDGNNARCVTYARLIEQFNVQMFISMGNDGPGVNTAGDPGLCDKVVGVGASITKQTYLDDYGIQKSYQDSLLYFSSRGPREDGGFQPLIVAPGAAVSSFPMWQPGSGLPYTLPPGYALANGTSMAAPQSTGAAALMISAAKATGVQHQPAQLRQAITSTARFITEPENDGSVRLQPFDQGNGLFNVEAAWTMLSGAAGRHQDGRHHVVGRHQQRPRLVPGDPEHRPRHLRPRVVVGDPAVHVHPDERRGRRHHVQRELVRRRRDVRLAGDDQPGEEPADDAQRDGQPRHAGRSLGDPPPGRSGHGGRRLRDAEHRHQVARPLRVALLADGQRRHRHRPAGAPLLPRPDGHADLQGRHDRRQHRDSGPARCASCAGRRGACRLTRTRSPTATTRPPRLVAARGARRVGPCWTRFRVSGRSPSTHGARPTRTTRRTR